MTAQIKSLLLDARLPRLEVRMLLEYVLAKPRAWLLAHDTDPVSYTHLTLPTSDLV